MSYRDSSFLIPKISAKFQHHHPNEGAIWRWGRLKSAIFNQYLTLFQKPCTACKIGMLILKNPYLQPQIKGKTKVTKLRKFNRIFHHY